MWDGAWWPYSYNLVDELPGLVETMDKVAISRVTVGLVLWRSVPHQIAVHGNRVGVGWFAVGRDRNEIMLSSYRDGFRTLLVIPPGTVPATARWLMTTPTPIDGTCTATELLLIAAALSEAGPADD
jgi:hypothetical protein